MGGAALLDNETGLVWDRNPEVESQEPEWIAATYACANRFVGGRQGWRLPTAEEMTTLRDDSADHTPDGAPFPPSNVIFWTSSSELGNPTGALAFNLDNPGFIGTAKDQSPFPGWSVWCVRGPQTTVLPH
jgi:hypothetical protein